MCPPPRMPTRPDCRRRFVVLLIGLATLLTGFITAPFAAAQPDQRRPRNPQRPLRQSGLRQSAPLGQAGPVRPRGAAGERDRNNSIAVPGGVDRVTPGDVASGLFSPGPTASEEQIADRSRELPTPEAIQQSWPASYRSDAHLYEVAFVNARTGWAVGDRGTILHTQDGGAQWTLQDSGIACRLESVHFVTPELGWAAGGYSVPFTHRGRGVILRTADGGKSWQPIESTSLPWLKGIRFFDAKRGIAYGLPTARHPSGLFYTHDGGLGWHAWTGTSRHWMAQAIDANLTPSKAEHLLMLEQGGNVWQVDGNSLRPVPSQTPLAEASELYITDGQWIVAGNQGLVRVSRNQGHRWNTPVVPPLREMMHFDWQAIGGYENHVWLAGAPGTRILHTDNGGRDWSWQETGQRLPIYAVDFVDERTGWAVGALGSIVATQDGGQSWVPQRGNDRRLAVMGIFGSDRHLPWQLVAHLATVEQLRVGGEIVAVAPRQIATRGQTPLATRLHEAFSLTGAAGANVIQTLPAPDRRLGLTGDRLHAHWNEVLRGDSVRQLADYLARQFRIWRPDMVIVDDVVQGEAGADDGGVAHALALHAVELAASGQLGGLHAIGLESWRVSTVTSTTRDVDRGYRVSATRLAPALGRTVGQVGDRARSMLTTSPAAEAETLGLRSAGGNLSSGPLVPPHASIRRVSPTATMESRRRGQAALRRRNLERLLRPTDEERMPMHEQVVRLSDQLPAEHSGELLWHAAYQALMHNDAQFASRLWRHLYSQMPAHHHAEAALIRHLWLLTSDEASLHWSPIRPPQKTVQRTGTAQLQRDGDVRVADFESSTDPREGTPDAGVVPASENPIQTLTTRAKLVDQFMDELEQTRPDLLLEPMVRFPLASFHRRVGRVDDAVRFWKSQLNAGSAPEYRTWAASEIALQRRDNTPARPVWVSQPISTVPVLDGRIDDDAWQSSQPISLRSTMHAASGPSLDATSLDTTLRAAHNSQYLFVAISCTKSPELAYPRTTELRQRDHELTRDRLQICLDTDRDGTTFWTLEVDDRGWASDRLMGDTSWNPKWFIAARATSQQWFLEIAIPRDQLAIMASTGRQVWGVGIQRIVPAVDWQTWFQAAPVESHPLTFGLLLLE